jgi:hypothetical protein
MAITKGQEEKYKNASGVPIASQALQWLWQYLATTPRLRCFECGPIHQSTLNLLLTRGSKIYHSDLITPLQKDDPAFWIQKEKSREFQMDRLLELIPPIPPNSLTAIFCWGLLDVVPREALPQLVERFHSFLEPNGALFCILREPSTAAGADNHWWFDTLTTLGSSNAAKKSYPYPPVTNREMERIFPGGNVKTFLTRTGRREIVGLK